MTTTKYQSKSPAKVVLDKEEQAIEEALDRGEFINRSDFVNTKKMLEEASARYLDLNTTKPVTIRINQIDLIRLKAKAKARKIPYQTLLSILINQYVEGETELVL